MHNQHLSQGKRGELYVALQLKNKGFTIIAHNYRQFFGEIDIIAQYNNLVVFVEVKLRKHTHIDSAELITHHKQKKISLVAKQFLSVYGADNTAYRFDVALVDTQKNSIGMRYIQNAFTIVE